MESEMSDGETFISNAENVRFGHPDLAHIARKRKYHCENMVHIIILLLLRNSLIEI